MGGESLPPRPDQIFSRQNLQNEPLGTLPSCLVHSTLCAVHHVVVCHLPQALRRPTILSTVGPVVPPHSLPLCHRTPSHWHRPPLVSDSLHVIILIQCAVMLSVAWQPKFERLLSLAAGDRGHKIARGVCPQHTTY